MWQAAGERKERAGVGKCVVFATLTLPLNSHLTHTLPQLADAPPPPSRRGKIPLEKGFSQVDWLRTARERAGERGMDGDGKRMDGMDGPGGPTQPL
jgi:hypothetical protein